MQKEAEKFDTFMAAVVKLTPGQVQEVCEKYPDVYPVNFNCPGQITVSGLTSQMKDFTADVRAAGGRAIPLKVKGAFHSPFMKEAAEAFAGELANVKVNKPGLPLYSNRTGKPYEDDVAGLLSSQICSPVQWETIIRNMIAAGVDTFIEIGPGKTLTNMIRKISKDVKAVTVTEYLTDYPAEVKGC
jgi:[acyl-carrier-protein] S-malonyltransferase